MSIMNWGRGGPEYYTGPNLSRIQNKDGAGSGICQLALSLDPSCLSGSGWWFNIPTWLDGAAIA